MLTDAEIRAAYAANREWNSAMYMASDMPAGAKRAITKVTSQHLNRIDSIERRDSEIGGRSHVCWIIRTEGGVWTRETWIVGPRGKSVKV